MTTSFREPIVEYSYHSVRYVRDLDKVQVNAVLVLKAIAIRRRLYTERLDSVPVAE